LGISQDHVYPIIEQYQPTHIVFFSSIELKEQTMQLAEALHRKQGIPVEIEYLSPFSDNALPAMMEIISDAYHRLQKTYNNHEIQYYIGITGGTNLMVLAAGLFAHRLNVKMHYVLNPAYAQGSEDNKHNGIIEIDPASISSS